MALRNTQGASRNLSTQSLTLGSSAGGSTAAFGTQTYTIRLCSTQLTKYVIAEAPSVSSTTILQTGANLPPNIIEHVAVTPGQRLSAITTSTAADLTVTETSA